MTSTSKDTGDGSGAMAVFFTGREKLQDFTISWVIDDMKVKMEKFKPGEKIKTDTFAIRDTKWHFDFYPNGNIARHKGKISIFLVSENDGKVTADCEFMCGPTAASCGVPSEQGWFRTLSFSNNEFTPVDNDYGFNAFLGHTMVVENEAKVLAAGRMEFFMKVSVKGEEKTIAKVLPPKKTLVTITEIDALRQLSENFESLRCDEQFSDFQIVCGDENFSCHRNILASRSSYFRALFNSRMDEYKTGKLDIVDMDSDTVKDVITYIYTSQVEDLDFKAHELLAAADRYDLPGLKKSCENSLIVSMSQETVLDLFVLADMHNANELRVAAKKMIVENRADIVKQDGWRDKLGKYNDLIFEVFEAVVTIN